ncbi:hypothetical protein A374_12870 [Fictibacillus macauensis ZFHKF-1]|uniref:N-acetyltransferase domain-containing protein n=1 Tax=Fictibacillus macauensis ZFHKF-1 TaxID=1196324 RepID=I8AHL7_9BACL|nr:GNAT family N-acetyltransferase [Fictibacillus macauensis]EIT84939.1 hypothetical protein A374_12870 [Fictibacillus macauensis ZFHKF-1]
MNKRAFTWSDLPFIRHLFQLAGKLWQQEEGIDGTENDAQLTAYLQRYVESGGEWFIFEENDKKIGAAYVTYAAPSNGKPWLGTLLVAELFQKKGYAHAIIACINDEIKNNHTALFAACPVPYSSWLLFLNHLGFEQMAFEKDEFGKEYIKLVKALTN